MGEGMPDDELLMKYISSANIACGYHAGDVHTIRQTIRLCLQYGVAVGAHPSFLDRENFGRTEIQVEGGDLYDLITEQLELFAAIVRDCDAVLHHVKPHGALYNMAARDRAMADVVASAVYDFDSNVILYALAGSHLIEACRSLGLKTAAEAFADRSYQSNGQLTPRGHANAMITSAEEASKQVLQMVRQQEVTTAGGIVIPVHAETVCIHGDGKDAIIFAQSIYDALKGNGIHIQPSSQSIHY